MKPEQAKFVYVARGRCGCVFGLVSDYADKETARDVADFIKSGLSIERASLEEYRTSICIEPGFLNCPHVKAELEQLNLFEVPQ